MILIWIPFLLVSLVAGVVCFAVPRLRSYAIESAVAPLAFGPSAILGTGCFGMIAEARHVTISVALSNALAVFVFVASGVTGANLAILLVRYFRRRKPMAERFRLEAHSKSGSQD